MPISAENKKRYPPNWAEIRKQIQERAGDKCELCGVENHAIGYRKTDGEFVKICMPNDDKWEEVRDAPKKCIRIVCTVMHLDHTPENCHPDNLKFGCQRCHNRYDSAHRAESRKARKERESGQLTIGDVKTGQILHKLILTTNNGVTHQFSAACGHDGSEGAQAIAFWKFVTCPDCLLQKKENED